MKITVLVAGTNEPSNSNVLADSFVEGLKQFEGMEVTKHRLKDEDMKHFTLDFYDPDTNQGESLAKLQSSIEESDGFVISTPIWNFGVPAHLKNFIDRMGSFALDETRSRGTLGGKPFYLIFTGGAPAPAWKGLMRKTTSFVPEALSYFGGTYVGNHFEGICTLGRGKFGLVVDQRPDSLASVKQKGLKFAKTVDAFLKTGKLPFVQRTRKKLMRIGEKIMKKIF